MLRLLTFVGNSMATRLASKAWSCESLQRGMVLARAMPLQLESPTESQLAEMQKELEKLEAGVVGEGTATKTHKRIHVQGWPPDKH